VHLNISLDLLLSFTAGLLILIKNFEALAGILCRIQLGMKYPVLMMDEIDFENCSFDGEYHVTYSRTEAIFKARKIVVIWIFRHSGYELRIPRFVRYLLIDGEATAQKQLDIRSKTCKRILAKYDLVIIPDEPKRRA